MSVVELNAVTGVRQYLGDETFEFQEFFLRHVMILLNDRPTLRARSGSRSGLALRLMKATEPMPLGARLVGLI